MRVSVGDRQVVAASVANDARQFSSKLRSLPLDHCWFDRASLALHSIVFATHDYYGMN